MTLSSGGAPYETDAHDDWTVTCVICGDEGPYRCLPGLGAACSGCRMQAMREEEGEDGDHDND